MNIEYSELLVVAHFFSFPKVTWQELFLPKAGKQKATDRDDQISLEYLWNGGRRFEAYRNTKLDFFFFVFSY